MCSVPSFGTSRWWRPQRPDGRRPREFTPARLAASWRRSRDFSPRSSRRPPPCEAESAGGITARHRRGARQPGRGRHARPAHAARGRARLRGAAGRPGPASAGSREAAGLGSTEALAQVDRIDQTAIPSLRASASCPRRSLSLPTDLVDGSPRSTTSCDRCCAPTPWCPPSTTSPPSPWLRGRCSTVCSATCSRALPSMRRASAVSTSTLARWRSRPAGHHRRRPGIPGPGRSASSSRSCGWRIYRAVPASGSSRPATWPARWVASSAVEPREPHGSQFVLNLAFVGPSA